jgi:hypothetical protein
MDKQGQGAPCPYIADFYFGSPSGFSLIPQNPSLINGEEVNPRKSFQFYCGL